MWITKTKKAVDSLTLPILFSGWNKVLEEALYFKKTMSKQSSNIQKEIKVIMIGKSGNGKSSTGNTLLGNKGFTVARRLNAVTEKCQIETGCLVTKQKISVVDTPGLFDVGTSLGKRALEIQRAVEICPKPNAFLLVFSSHCRFTDEELFTVDLMRVIFGDKIFKHMCIVFTHGNEFKDEDEFKNFWVENEYVKDLVERCNDRIFKIENSNQSQDEDENFFNLIHTISNCPEYEYRYLAIHQAALQEHLDKYTPEDMDTKKQIEDLVERLSKRLDSKIWKDKLFAGGAIVGSLTAAGAVIIAAPNPAAKALAVVGAGSMLAGSMPYMKQLWPSSEKNK